MQVNQLPGDINGFSCLGGLHETVILAPVLGILSVRHVMP